MTDEDLPVVVSLLGSALGPAPGGVDRRALFEWKHLANPAGRSIALVCAEEGRIVGLRTFMRWRLTAPGSEAFDAVRAVDTATDPGWGRRGVFSTLTRAGLEECQRQGIRLVFNTPNDKSRPGYLKMGWSEVGKMPMWIRVRRPVGLARAVISRDLASSGPAVPPAKDTDLIPAAEAFEDPAVVDLLERAALPETGIFTPRSPRYLRWRYSEGPVPYHALLDGDPPRAMAVARLRSRGKLRELVVCELFAEPGGGPHAESLMRSAPGRVGADHAVAHFGAGWPWFGSMRRAGFRRVPRAGMRLTVRAVSAQGEPDPGVASNWSLTLGDLELF